VLKYTPDEVRAMTCKEIEIALEGHLESMGVTPPEERFMTRNELLNMMGK
jgi:hypothetical protein